MLSGRQSPRPAPPPAPTPTLPERARRARRLLVEELVVLDLLLDELEKARDGLSRAQLMEVMERLGTAADGVSEAVSTLE